MCRLASTDEFANASPQDVRECFLALESQALRVPATAVLSPLGLALPESHMQVCLYLELLRVLPKD
jgi:hypothetical protein